MHAILENIADSQTNATADWLRFRLISHTTRLSRHCCQWPSEEFLIENYYSLSCHRSFEVVVDQHHQLELGAMYSLWSLRPAGRRRLSSATSLELFILRKKRFHERESSRLFHEHLLSMVRQSATACHWSCAIQI